MWTAVGKKKLMYDLFLIGTQKSILSKLVRVVLRLDPGALIRCHAVYCSAYRVPADIPSMGMMTLNFRWAAPVAVCITAPSAVVPAIMTV